MENKCIIAEAGLVDILYEMNNPITNIRLCLELFGSASVELRQEYLNIIGKSALALELSIHDICSAIAENDLSVQFKPGATQNISSLNGNF